MTMVMVCIAFGYVVMVTWEGADPLLPPTTNVISLKYKLKPLYVKSHSGGRMVRHGLYVGKVTGLTPPNSP